MPFGFEVASATVAQLHAWPHKFVEPGVVVMEPIDAAMVLGSTQRRDLAVSNGDQIEVGGVAVTRRRSGGGAVWVNRADQTWVNIVVPRDHALYDEDVRRSFAWVGQVWRTALLDLEVSSEVWPARYDDGDDLSDVCFASRGPGEVFDPASGRKLVGISQRRTREGSLFQCQIQRGEVDVQPYRAVFGLTAPQTARLLADHIGTVNPHGDLVNALRQHLPA